MRAVIITAISLCAREWEDEKINSINREPARASHRNGQERIYNMPPVRPEVYLTLDPVQMGLGGGSCGPGPMDKYRIRAEPVSFGYLMRPCKAGWSKLSKAARKRAVQPR